jgi:hypothetical protein
MRATNATIRRHKKEGSQAQIAGLLAMGYQERTARLLLEPDFCGRIGFPNYELTNKGANIRRMKQRVEHITRLQNTPATETEGDNARIELCPSENRVKLFFPGKPAADIRERLKRGGFRWSPTQGAWMAYPNWQTEQLAKQIAGIEADPVVKESLTAQPTQPAPDDLAARFERTHETFKESIGRIADVAGKTVLEVFALWRNYSNDCSSADQSAIMGEFVNWYRDQLGGNRAALEDALSVSSVA